MTRMKVISNTGDGDGDAGCNDTGDSGDGVGGGLEEAYKGRLGVAVFSIPLLWDLGPPSFESVVSINHLVAFKWYFY